MIKNDLFNISYRLKNIDSGYFVIFNKNKDRYEVHNKKQGRDTFCFCCDKKILDKSVLDKAFKTNIRNVNKIIKEIEENNLALERKNNEKIMEKGLFKFNEFVRFADKTSKNMDFENVDITRWF